MEILLNLPTDVLAYEVLPYLTISELVCGLDSAVTSYNLRPKLFEVYSSLSIANNDYGLTLKQLSWLLHRSVRVDSIKFYKKLDKKEMHDIIDLLTSRKDWAGQIKNLDLSPCRRIATSVHYNELINICPSLEGICLSNCNDVSITVLTRMTEKCKNIKSLDLSGTGVSNHDIVTFVEKCPSITSLNLRSCLDISDEAVAAISRNCSNLKCLDISLTSEFLTDASLVALSQNCQDLEKLNLSSCNVSDAGVTSLAKNNSSMKDLDLSFCYRINDASVTAVGKIPTLRYLNLSGIQMITDIAAVSLARRNPSLVNVDLSYCHRVSDSALLLVSQHCDSVNTDIDDLKSHSTDKMRSSPIGSRCC